MKNLFLILVLIFSINSYSQDVCINCPPAYEYVLEINDSTETRFPAPVILEDSLDKLFEGLKEKDIDLSFFCDFQGIYMTSFKFSYPSFNGIFGFTNFYYQSDKAFIALNSDNLTTYLPSFTEVLLYHEMFHFLLPHVSHTEHVSEPYITSAGYYIDIENAVKIWDDSEKKKYFSFIKKNIWNRKTKNQKRIEKENCNKFEKVTATVYHAVPAQTNNDPSHTAFMFKLDLNNPYKHRIIAVSRDLLKKFPAGSKVRVTGTNYDGIWTVNDKMNKRYTKRIDFLINQDMKIGKWTNVKIELVKE